jgi:splicing factor 45
MARMGYKEGQGLGREEQGISSALSVEKTSKRGGVIVAETPVTSPVESITEIMKTPSKVVQLRNMVASGEVDDLLEDETKEECGKYGEVVRVVIFEVTEADEEFPVRIFVEFRRMESAIKGLRQRDGQRVANSLSLLAVVDLNGRYFGGRVVRANFFDVEKFKRLELKE